MKVRHSKSEIRRVLVVTGDPGGARVLIPAVTFLRKKHPRWKFDVLAGRNSFALWKDAGFRPKRWPSKVMERFAADKTLFSKSPDVLVTGTSFENPTESRFRRAAHEMNVPSFSALDHWCNYRHRYELTGKLILPDLIGVMDDFAVTRMVESGIPRKHLTVVGHPVLEPFLKKKKRATSDGSTSLTTGRRQILYLSEPISWDGNLNPRVIRYPRHNELTVLTNLLAVFARHPEILGYDLRIRPHPLEPLSRIKAVLRNHAPSGLRVTIDRSHSLEEEFDASRVVLGITSIALL